MRTLKEVFGVEKPIIGMLHLSGYGREKVLENAKREIDIMYRNGVNAVLVENYFGDRVDVENALKLLQKDYPDKVYGVNMLGFPEMAFDLARKYGAKFVQMDSVCGHLEPTYEKSFLKKLETLRGDGDIFLLGGVRFKYQSVRSGRSLEEDLKLGMERCDAIVVTGEGTGISTDLEKIKTFRTILGDFPLIVGAGMTAETAKEQLAFSDGAIVGSYFKEYGEAEYPVEEKRVDWFMTAVAQGRKSDDGTVHSGFEYEKVAFGEGRPHKLFGTYIGCNAESPAFVYPTGAVITGYTGNAVDVVIPSFIDGLRVIGIGEKAFYGNQTIRTLEIGEGVLRVGVEAFAHCSNLRNVHFPVSLEMIDYAAFIVTSLEAAAFPSRLRKIGREAFAFTKISEVVLPNMLDILGHLAFCCCEELKRVVIPAGIEAFWDYDGAPWDDLAGSEFGKADCDLGLFVNTFSCCCSLNVVESQYDFTDIQKNQIFGDTPWLEAQKKD